MDPMKHIPLFHRVLMDVGEIVSRNFCIHAIPMSFSGSQISGTGTGAWNMIGCRNE